ncbi:DUF934 domain-containing protein [Ramlibacter sp.]|uniref:DUF934 domain-containing protein n=1 Tax=Ramlibacter sp. TaxID=1917967 RepID=UPI002CF35B51|nr:DUF934 domain-containing protein [Ramlibacter sp.]HWI80396.1 DUF934 domain-containing protein [Ramlibacter sp.]
MQQTIELLAAGAVPADERTVLRLGNDADPLGAELAGVQRIELHFPKFSDGRAFSQALLLRRRRGFRGDIRATGDVLVDQLVQMQRSGFSSAVLRADQNVDFVPRQFDRYPAFYQGDAQDGRPRFAKGHA